MTHGPGAPMMGALAKLRTLPAFLASIFFFYWSLPIGVITYTIKFAQFTSKRNDMYTWSKFVLKVFRIKVLKYGTNSLYKAGPVLYLCNHRSWADFFLDVYLTEGTSALMSRWLVFFVFPIFMTSVIILKGVVLFKRGTIADKKKFNEWLDGLLQASPIPGLLVYPEGHRSTRPTSLPIKRGMLHYAHSRKMPVQIIITKNKEVVLSEKTHTVNFGTTVVAGYSEVVQTEGLEFEEFFTKLQAAWHDTWERVYNADQSKLPVLVQDDVPQFDYSQKMRVQQFCISLLSAAIFLGVVFLGIKLLLVTTAVLGAVGQKVLISLLVAWLTISVATSTGNHN